MQHPALLAIVQQTRLQHQRPGALLTGQARQMAIEPAHRIGGAASRVKLVKHATALHQQPRLRVVGAKKAELAAVVADQGRLKARSQRLMQGRGFVSFPRSCVGMHTDAENRGNAYRRREPQRGMGSHGGSWEPDSPPRRSAARFNFGGRSLEYRRIYPEKRGVDR